MEKHCSHSSGADTEPACPSENQNIMAMLRALSYSLQVEEQTILIGWVREHKTNKRRIHGHESPESQNFEGRGSVVTKGMDTLTEKDWQGKWKTVEKKGKSTYNQRSHVMRFCNVESRHRWLMSVRNLYIVLCPIYEDLICHWLSALKRSGCQPSSLLLSELTCSCRSFLGTKIFFVFAFISCLSSAGNLSLEFCYRFFRLFANLKMTSQMRKLQSHYYFYQSTKNLKAMPSSY